MVGCVVPHHQAVLSPSWSLLVQLGGEVVEVGFQRLVVGVRLR